MRMTPIVVIPGLYATPRFYEAQLAELWQRGPVQFANHTRDDTIAAIATRILDEAPARFALVGHSMGGYIAFESCVRRARALLVSRCSIRPPAPMRPSRRRGAAR